MITDITVATGTINGLIIYSNIVRASNAIYFIATIGIFGEIFVYHVYKQFMSLKAIKRYVNKYKNKHKLDNEEGKEIDKKKQQTAVTLHTIAISELEDPLL